MHDSRTYAFESDRPDVAESARVSREATLVGDVTVAADASIWPGVVLRGDVGPVRIGRQAHVGDTAVLHASSVGEDVMVGHGAVCNDAVVDDGALIGFNATLNSEVSVGTGSIVASGTVVPQGYSIPADSFARGVPAQVTPLSETTIDVDRIHEEFASGAYTDLAGRHEELFAADPDE
ncbi:Carbonic anhydrase or acetyltransferase, isoleucine patch superfamily [Natronoarchaeum philippinense]|uniref:Carbonic anhydrase or acetyltransferase, isoleucine patch superfamily n=1 Tax=Natronoarchaeum philippinense TaxID=558529 RepID=A0A285P8M1_NATPI|nr:gamma carbonic anhydrase family protein [Natronoarchaeum philippinense]SNZ18099.1 Carbonic anhydrase or acetyltransferase, isoleucine patch superfamily [Natronoarchaeum philippinense]